MPDFSILIPHKRNPENDKALRIALDCIVANTQYDYELIVDATTPADPYVVINSMAERARGEYIFFSNSDIFVADDWDYMLLGLSAPDTIVNCTLVESGAIGVHEANIHHSFGMTPDTFDRVGFEAFAKERTELPANNGFVFYGLIHRKTFLKRGGFDVNRGKFPSVALDRLFWEQWEADGLRIVRAKSFVYHLQNYSNPDEQTKAVRYG